MFQLNFLLLEVWHDHLGRSPVSFTGRAFNCLMSSKHLLSDILMSYPRCTEDFRAELTAVQGRGAATGEHVQGVLNLLDNLEEETYHMTYHESMTYRITVHLYSAYFCTCIFCID